MVLFNSQFNIKTVHQNTILGIGSDIASENCFFQRSLVGEEALLNSNLRTYYPGAIPFFAHPSVSLILSQ